MKSIDFGLLGIGFLFLLMVWISKAYRIYAIARGMGQKISFSDCLQIYLATCFISHVTPFNAGGTPLEIYLLHKKGISIGKATAVTTIDLGLHSAVYVILLLLAVFYNVGFLKHRDLLNYSWYSKLLAVFVLSGIIAGAILALFRLKWAGKIGLFLKRRNWLIRLKQELHLFKEGSFLLIRSNLPKMTAAIAASISYWFFYLILAPFILWAMGKSVSLLRVIYAQLFFNVAQTLIPTPGGSGGSEVLLSYLFRGLIGPQGIAAFVLIWRTYTFYSTLILGGYYFWKLAR